MLVSAVDPSTEEVANVEGIDFVAASVIVEDICEILELDVDELVEDDDVELEYCEEVEDADA